MKNSRVLCHFPFTPTLEEGQKQFRERTKKHFANTHQYMADAEHIAMVTNSTESIDAICHFIIFMESLYSAKITHINIRDGAEKKRKVIALSNDSMLYDYTFHDAAFRGIAQHRGNEYEWRRILSKCRRTQNFSPPEKPGKDSCD